MRQPWKGLLLGLAAAAILVSPIWAEKPKKGGAKEAEGINWVRDYEQAVKQSTEEGRWMFVDFYTDS